MKIGHLLRPIAVILLSVAALLPLSALAGQGSPTLFSAMEISTSASGQKMDPIVLPDLSGHIIQSDRQHSRLTLVVFWAAWCGDCRREMPTLVNLFKKFKDKGLQILAVDLMEPPETVRTFKNTFAVDFPILLDLKGEFGRKFGLHAIPTTFLLDRQGRLIGKASGYHDWNSREAAGLVTSLLAEQ